MSESKVNDSIRPDNKLFKNVRLKTRLIFGQLMEYKPLGHRNIIIAERMKIIYYESMQSSESWKIYVELFLSEYSLPLRIRIPYEGAIIWGLGVLMHSIVHYNSLKFLANEIKFLQGS